MKNQKTVSKNFTIKLWKDNRVDQEYSMTLEEFKEKFFAWMRSGKKEVSWFEYYFTRSSVCEFIGVELKSGADFEPGKIDVYEDIAEEIKEEFWNVVNELQNK